jgi:CHAT domain-containing protein
LTSAALRRVRHVSVHVAQGLAILLVASALHGREPLSDPVDIRAALSAGRYGDAEAGARALLAARAGAPSTPQADLAEARELLADALARLGRSRDPEARALADAALTQREAAHAQAPDEASALRLADCLVTHARVLADQADWPASRTDLARALTLREHQGTLDEPALAGLWEDWAATTLELRAGAETWAAAEQAVVRAESLRTRLGAVPPLAQARLLELRARVLRRRGVAYAEALALAQQAQTLREAVAPRHPDLVQTYNLVGELSWFVHDLLAAREAHERALELAREVLGPDHPAVAVTLAGLALAEFDDGAVTRALEHQQAALELLRDTRATGHRELFDALQDLANMQQNRGAYAAADALYRELLGWVPEHVRADSDQAAHLHFNRGVLRRRMGDLDGARDEFEQALALWQACGAPSGYLSYPLEGLAEVAALSGDLAGAEQHLEHLRRLQQDIQGTSAPGQAPTPQAALDLAWTLTTLADVLDRQGRASEAKALVQQALAHARGARQVSSGAYARVLRLLAELALRHGDATRAVAWLREARERVEELYGSAHPDVAELQGRLAQALLVQGQPLVAQAAARAALELRALHERQLLGYLSPAEALAYTSAEPRARDVLLTLAARGDADARRRAWNALANTRAPVLEELLARQRTRAPSVALDEQDAQLEQAKARLAQLYFRAGTGDDVAALERLKRARTTVENLERSRAARVRLGRAQAAPTLELDYAGSLAHLPHGARLVSFVAYCDATRVAPAPGMFDGCVGQRRYAALVARTATDAPDFVALGSLREVEAAVQGWHAQVERAQLVELLIDERGPAARALEARYRAEADALVRLVWQPLAERLRGAKRVLLVPDGALQRVAFQALPGPRPGSFLVEQDYALHQLPSERALLLPARARASEGGLLALGIRAFETQATRTSAAPGAARPGKFGARVLRSGARGLWFDDLPSASREAALVAEAWRRATGKPATLLLDAAATKAALRVAVRGQRVVHLATHGYFLDALASAAPPNSAPTRAASARGIGSMSPLLRVGLALAGANAGAAREPPGEALLSAEELAELPLADTDWVVLSACGSGLGDVRFGEGVLGLQRALLIAGARSVVMSLWDVPDDEAPALMQALYDERFKRGRDTSTALQAAQRRRLAQRRREGRSTHPFLWAAFVAAGDWR